MAGVALGFALAGTMFASIPMAARVTYPTQVRCSADTPAWIGVGIRDDGGPAPGAWVRTVRPGSPAAANKLAVGDVITAIDHQAIRNNDSLVRAVRSHRPGTTVTLTVKRGAGQFERPIILQQMPQAVWQAELRADAAARSR